MFHPESSVSLKVRVPAAGKHAIIHRKTNCDDSFHHLGIEHRSGSLQSMCCIFYTYCPTSFSPQACGMYSINYSHFTDVTTEAKKDARSCSNSRNQQVSSRGRFQPRLPNSYTCRPTRELFFMLCWLMGGGASRGIHLFHYMCIDS